MASHPYRARGCRHHRGSRPHGRIWLLLGRSLEANLVDRLGNLLDRIAALRANRKAAVLASPAVHYFGSAQGTRGYLDVGDAAGSSPRLPVQPWPVRLADAVGQSFQAYRAPVFILIQRGGRGWTCRDDDQEPWRFYQQD